MLHLETVTPDNWRVDLKVREDQAAFVSDLPHILARAYAYRNCRSRVYIIYKDTIPIGMALYYDVDALQNYNLSQFFIDHHYQGQGYGEAATRLLLQKMKEDGKYRKVALCYVEGDTVARKLYDKLGFKPTGEVDEDEIVMEMSLTSI